MSSAYNSYPIQANCHAMNFGSPGLAFYAVLSNLLYSLMAILSGFIDYAQAGSQAVILGFLKINSGLVLIISAYLLWGTYLSSDLSSPGLWLSAAASTVMIIAAQASPPSEIRPRANRHRIPAEILILCGVLNLGFAFFLLTF